MKLSNSRGWVAIAVVAALAGCHSKQPKTNSATGSAKAASTTKATGTAKGSSVKAKPAASGLALVKLAQATATKKDTAGLATVVKAIAGSTLKAGQPLKLHFVVENPGDAARSFCDYHTPFEGVRNNIFTLVDSSGKKLRYQGIMAKRRPPSIKNYWTVPAKSRAQVEFDLARGYKLAAGTYKLHFAGNDISGLPASKPIEIVVTK